MAEEVTDPAVLAAFDKQAPAPEQHGEEVTDPTILAKFPDAAAASGQHPNSTPDLPMDEMPFGDQRSLSTMSNINEYKLYLGHRYGDKNVVTDFDSDGNPNLIVSTPDGKKYRIGPPGGKEPGPSFIAEIAGQAPKFIGGIMGSIAGAPAGPLGMVAGAGLGAMAGDALMKGQKAFEGNYDETPQEGLNNLAISGKEGVESEMGGQIAGKAVSKALTFRLPRFITGATDESVALGKEAVNAGAKPSYRSVAPGMTHLARIEVLDEKLSGRNVKADELNMGYVKEHIKSKLTANGYPKGHVDEFLDTLDKPDQAISNQNTGEQLKASVEAHVKAMTDSIDQSAKVADDHIGSQLESVTKGIDASKSGDLSGDFGRAWESANADFKTTASQMYDKAHALVNGRAIVPTDGVAAAAKRIVAQIREASPTQVSALQKDLSQRLGRQVSEDDAVLMAEFGLELPPDGKMTLQAAQRLRTLLKEKAGASKFSTDRNASNHDYGELASALDDAIHASGGDPAARGAIDALDKADAFWKANVRKFENVKTKNIIKRIKSGDAPDPDALVGMIAGKGNSQRIESLKAVVGPEMWSKVQAAHMDKYLRKFGVTQPDGKSMIDGYKMLDDIQDGDQTAALRAIHGPEVVSQLREIAKMVATRQGKLDPAVLKSGNVKAALEQMKAQAAARDKWMSTNALRVLADPNKTGEEAYQYLARGHDNGGNENRIQAVVDTFGKDSPQVLALRQAMLEEIARTAKMSSIMDRGSGGLDKAMSQFSKSQLENVFPKGFASDMHQLSKVIKFMFPQGSGDTAMAGMEAGAIQSHKTALISRVYRIQMASLMRFVVMHPSVVKTLVLGREEGEEAWMRGTANLFKKMAQAGTQVSDSNLDADNFTPQDKGGAPLPQRPGQQPPTPMPGPGTVQ